MPETNKPMKPMVVTEEERKLLELLRQIDFGQVTVVVRKGELCYVDEVHKTIQLK